MRRLLKRLIKYLVYLGAGLVILLAVAVGLFRLFLPRLPEYQDEIKNWASASIGVQVEFSEMDARWRLRGPELSFHDAELVSRDHLASLLRAEEVSIGVALLRLLADRELTADRILIRDATIDVSVDEAGYWYLQGVAIEEFPDFATEAAGDTGALSIVGEDIRFEFRRPDLDQPVIVTVDRSEFRRDELQQVLEASIALPEALGDRLQLAASRRLAAPGAPWQFFVEAESLDAAGWSRLAPAGWPGVASGAVDLSLWVDVEDRQLRSATANFAADDLITERDADTAPFAAEGRVEFTRSATGWLLAADNLLVETGAGAWPDTRLQLRATRAADGNGQTLSGSATYFRLDDIGHVLEWLPEAQRELLEALAPVGVVRDAAFALSGGEMPGGDFHLSADMDRVGFDAHDGWPGIRGFSGSLRADQSGGRLEIDAAGAELDLARWLDAPIAMDAARGTVVWRRNERGTTLLSDSIAVQNADVTIDSSFQATLPADGSSPVVDVRSRWSVRDVGVVDAYLPPDLIKPGLYRWLDDALVAGRITGGSARLAGPLDRFPFDGGEGIFHVEAQVENAILRYSGLWPDARELSAHVVVDKTRLYSVENSAVSVGNRTVDAEVEIPDLREPVLRIDAQATGTLETIRRFSVESPIARAFGGRLDRVRAEGAASFDLQLAYPILDRENYEFSTALRSDGGTLNIEGLAAPITDLTGLVTISRESIATDSLQGGFLGDPVALDLERAVDGPYGVIVTGRGTVSDRGLADGLGAPFADVLTGSTGYVARVRFPRAGAAERRPIEVAIDSGLEGMGIQLPAPAGKEPDEQRRMSFVIAFPEAGLIDSHGRLTDAIRWNLNFVRRDAGWDFDRGTVALGGADPGVADTRGLHVAGQLRVLDVDEWLALGNRDGRGGNFGERVRSVDVVADELTVLGQQLARHHLTVDRSAHDWAVRIDGDNAAGAISLPYDFAGERPLVLDMDKLLLPAAGDDRAERPQDEPRRDPRTLPAISVRASEFALGERRFGSIRVDLDRTGAGLVGEVETTSESFFISGRAGWVADETDEAGQRSFLNAQLVSSNVEQTMRELDYLSGVESESLLAEVDLSWSGGFGHHFLATLDGSVSVEFGTGQLDEVEPGAGRVFGLMSIVALPRRLALDFRDVFDRGFGFDAITGTFRLADGEAYTCDLSLKGPAADVGIVGRAGLVDEQYQQAAVVSANVGNTLPVVGAVVAGPQVAAALLIFSQIFKKPLQEMGQIYYRIEGPWDDPVIDSADAPTFAETSALAGCLEAAE